ncbi:MAG: Gfo/Idh/MocA family oxidoreductase [Planctomycetota bacterium]
MGKGRKTRRLRAALAACGGISDLTLQAAERSPDFQVVALQDPRKEALQQVGDRYGIRARHLRFEDLLAEEVDFVIVNSPNHVHRPQVEQVLKAGKPCLVQKPMAPNLDDARAMVLAAREAGLPLGVTMFEHSRPENHQVKEMVRSGWLGEPTLLQALSAHDIYLKNPPPEEDWRRDPRKVGGGAFIQLAVHHINLARWFLDREIVRVCMFGARGHTVFKDETDVASMLFENGPAAQFAASYAARASHFLIAGTRGTIQLQEGSVTVRGDDPYPGPVFNYEEAGQESVFKLSARATGEDAEGDRYEVHGRFARFIRDGSEFPCTAESALRDMEAVAAAYRSRDEGRPVSLP